MLASVCSAELALTGSTAMDAEEQTPALACHAQGLKQMATTAWAALEPIQGPL